MDAAKLAKWCEQQSRLLGADWEFQCRAGSGNHLPAAPALPAIRDELVERLLEIDPRLASVVEDPLMFSRSDSAAVKLTHWAELLAAMAPADAEPASVAERKALTASVNALVIDVLVRKPESSSWSARRFAVAIGCSKSAVADSDAFKKLETARELARLDRAEKAQEANQRWGRR
jgi:hypothetical protein